MIAPPLGYATWLDYAVTNMETRSLEIDSLITASFAELPPHWPEGTTREQMYEAVQAEFNEFKINQVRLKQALRMLVEAESAIDDRNFPVTLRGEVTRFLTRIYGEARPIEDGVAIPKSLVATSVMTEVAIDIYSEWIGLLNTEIMNEEEAEHPDVNRIEALNQQLRTVWSERQNFSLDVEASINKALYIYAPILKGMHELYRLKNLIGPVKG